MDCKQTLRQKGLRITPIREAVLDILNHADSPLDNQEILNRLNSKSVDADLVTVYRMTETFTSHNIIKQVDFQDGKRRYEIEGDHHHHLICTQCGKVQAIHEPCVAVSEQTVKEKYAFTVTRHQLEFFGLCKKCTK